MRRGYNVYFCEDDIVCLSEKRIQCAFLSGVYNVCFCEVDIVCLSEKRMCVFLCRGYSFVYLKRGYSVSIWEDDILCIFKKRI